MRPAVSGFSFNAETVLIRESSSSASPRLKGTPMALLVLIRPCAVLRPPRDLGGAGGGLLSPGGRRIALEVGARLTGQRSKGVLGYIPKGSSNRGSNSTAHKARNNRVSRSVSSFPFRRSSGVKRSGRRTDTRADGHDIRRCLGCLLDSRNASANSR